MTGEPSRLEPMGTQSKETVDIAAAKGQDAEGWSRKSTDQALDDVAVKVDHVKARAAKVLDKGAGMASSMADKAKDQFQTVKDQFRARAANVSDKVADYTQDDPIKAMLIAAAAGALLMGLLSMIVRSGD